MQRQTPLAIPMAQDTPPPNPAWQIWQEAIKISLLLVTEHHKLRLQKAIGNWTDNKQL
jgi:hypothetical protein